MDMPVPWAHKLTRRAILRTGAGAVVGAATAAVLPIVTHGATYGTPATEPAAGAGAEDAELLFRWLDARVEAAMAQFQIPGVAVGVYVQGQEYVRGYGVTNVDYPQPVDGDTLFRIGSTTKTFTGTAIIRLVEEGRMALDAPVRTYLPGLQLSDESVAARVTVRQLLNHSAGWLGEYYADTGRGEDALAKYVDGMPQLPQLTPPGQVFAYNNAAVALAGHVVEAVTGKPYEEAAQDLVIGPLGLDHTFFYSDDLIGYNVAASHSVDEGSPVVQPSFWPLWRSLHPTGGLISSVRDQLRYARFHLGDDIVTTGTSILSPEAIRAMRAEPGPGGTMGVEIDGIGVTWWQRRTAEGVPVFQHGGAWPGQHSGFYFVPDRGFAMTALTNSDGGAPFIAELFFTDDGALRPFAGLSNPPAVPRTLTPAELAPYEGRYLAREVDPPPGDAEETWFEVHAADWRLRARMIAGNEQREFDLAFYRDNYVVVLDDQGEPTAARADFVPGPNGRIMWFRFNGRLHTRQD